jgi:glucan phosphoethanolaminetransferase (alkaline phosphatase superfamily)
MAAFSIQAAPVLLKSRLDEHLSIDLHGGLTLACLCLAQMALTTIPGRLGTLIGYLVLTPGFLFTICNVMNISIFKSPVSIITLSTTVQSNQHEVLEFLATYGSKLAFSAGLALTAAVLLIILYRRAGRPNSYLPSFIALALSLISMLPLLHRADGNLKQVIHDIHELSYVDRLLTTFGRYRGIMQAREKAKAFWSERSSMNQNLQLRTSGKALPPLVIVVIGESTTRRHMGIHGYHRPTTAVLESMQDQLLVFQDAIAPVASTLPGVIGALCSSGFDPDSLECRGPTMIEIAKAAGYKTSWISNQAPSGFGDNFIVELGRTADATYFVNQDVSSAGEADHSVSYDGKVMEPLERVMASSSLNGEKNMIFVHLMGTHFIYEKRYPKDERLFQSTDDVRIPEFVKDRKAASIVNHYDNAVAYQDRILGGMLKRMNASGQEGFFIYFSDHGEEVYNSDNFSGHSEDRVTPAMREVPFIVGFSQRLLQTRQSDFERMKKLVDRPFSTFQLTPSLAGLLGLETDHLSQSDNVFSESFLPDRGTMRASSSTPSRPPHFKQ